MNVSDKDVNELSIVLDRGRDPLHLAAAGAQAQDCEALLSQGVDVDALDGQGRSALERALDDPDGYLGQERLNTALVLLRHGARLEPQGQIATRLMHALCEKDQEAGCRTLLALGVPAQAADAEGVTPLHVAARNGSVALCELLHAHGADVNERSKMLWTPMLRAAAAGQLDVMQWLAGKGADIHACNGNGESPLFYASLAEDSQPFLWLLGMGADPGLRTGRGNTPMEMVLRRVLVPAVMGCIAVMPDFDATAALMQTQKPRFRHDMQLPGNRLEAAFRCMNESVFMRTLQLMEDRGESAGVDLRAIEEAFEAGCGAMEVRSASAQGKLGSMRDLARVWLARQRALSALADVSGGPGAVPGVA